MFAGQSGQPGRMGALLRVLGCQLVWPSVMMRAAEPTDTHGPRADKWQYTLINPTPRDLLREMSTNRPDTTESPRTVDAGHFQFEASFVDYSYDRNSPDSGTTRGLAIAPTLLKAGLLNNVDFQLGIEPYLWFRTTDRDAGATEVNQGFGDTVLRLKVNLWGNDEGDTALALMPFVTLPTATDGVGAGKVQGGLIVPFSALLSDDFTLGLMVEFDAVYVGEEDRYIAEFVHTATISRPLVGNLDAFIEYAGFAGMSGGQPYIASFNAGLTYGVTPDWQLDAGVRVGLTRASEDVGLFAGMSMRY